MIDAGIYGGGGAPVQIDSPMNGLAKLLDVQGAQQTMQMGRLKMDEYQQGLAREKGLRGLLSQSYDNPAAREDALLKGGYVDQSLKLGKDRRENTKIDADTEYKKLESEHKRTELIGQALGYVKDNPTPENARATIQRFVQSGLMPAEFGQQKLAELERDPSPEGIRQRATRGYQEALDAKSQLPKYETRDLGGTTQTMAINPITGKTSVVNSIANSQSPDSVASNARMAADAAASRGQSERHFQSNQNASISKPFEVTGPEGTPVLVRQDKQGNITPVEGYTPKGPKLKDIPANANGKIIDGTQSITNIDSAIAAINKNPGALGISNAIPGAQTVKQWMGSDGVDARAQVANIGSLTLHDRSGAAVSASEFPRLAPFIPSASDTPAAATKKLQRMKQIATEELGLFSDTYSAEAGYKPSPILKKTATQPQPSAGGKPSVSNW